MLEVTAVAHAHQVVLVAASAAVVLAVEAAVAAESAAAVEDDNPPQGVKMNQGFKGFKRVLASLK